MEVDFVVVGSGTAGSVVASRLTEAGRSRVVLIEAGGADRSGITKIPAALVRTIGNRRYDWCFRSEPDATRSGASEEWSRGRVLGGSSAINGMVFIRGAPADFDRWAERGNAGWDWQSVLPLFRRLENSGAENDPWRGGLGPQRVSQIRYRHPLAGKFIEAAVTSGIPFRDDLNGEKRDGIGWSDGTINRGRRHSAYEAYIKPHLGRDNLAIRDRSLVERIVFSDGRATGVVVRKDGGAAEPETIKARCGVVLCAGAMNSPHLLMLSGIGPASELARFGISPYIDNREVGRNLIEHPGLYVRAEMASRTLNHYSAPWRLPWQVARWLISGDGPLGAPAAQAHGFCRSEADLDEPDIQILFFAYAVLLKNGRRFVPPENLATLLLNVTHPGSRGHLSLKSPDPTLPIAIHPSLLSDPADLEKLVRGLDLLRRIAATPPFGDEVVRYLDLPAADAGREEVVDYVRTSTRPFHHAAGTCRMGSEGDSVVTPELRVRGVEGLWVADASVMPCPVAGNINATTLMIGEKASDLIKSSVAR
jgi:choline dehydrogenase